MKFTGNQIAKRLIGSTFVLALAASPLVLGSSLLVGTAFAKDGSSGSGSGGSGSSGSGSGGSGSGGSGSSGSGSGSGSGGGDHSGSGGGDHSGGDNSGPGSSNSGPGGGDDGDDHARGDDRGDRRRGAEHVNRVNGAKIEINGNEIEVVHASGIKEEIEAGRYELKDATGRTVIERPATSADINRLTALARQ
ncbi:MAG: hypothetical protein ABWY13_04005 [Mesorhizobium sp.]